MFQKHKLPLDNRYNHSFRQTLPDAQNLVCSGWTKRSGWVSSWAVVRSDCRPENTRNPPSTAPAKRGICDVFGGWVPVYFRSVGNLPLVGCWPGGFC